MTFENDYNRALSAASSESKAKKIYVKHESFIYELLPSAAKRWGASPHFFTASSIERFGKKIMKRYQGGWIKWPTSETFPPQIQMHTKEGDIVVYLAIDVTGKHGSEIGRLVEERQHPKHNDMRHYKALLAESKKVKWPMRFPTDLTKHDHKELEHRLPDLPFGWILRESGTHLVTPESNINEKGESSSNYVRIIENSFGLDNAAFYAWDGKELRKMSPPSWKEWMEKKRAFMRGESY